MTNFLFQQQSPQEQTGTMGELDTAPPIELEQFVASGRNGRRNALADLGAAIDLDPGAYKLAEQLASLETGDQKPGCSGTGQAPANQNQASGSGENFFGIELWFKFLTENYIFVQ